MATLVERISAALVAAAGEVSKVRAEMTRYKPSDYGAKGWTVDPQVTSTFGPATGRVYTTRAKIQTAGTLSSVTLWVNTAGASNTALYVGIYSLAGVLLASSADVKAQFTSTGAKVVAMSAPTPALVAGQEVVVAYLVIGGTVPVIAGTASAPAANIGQTAGASNPLRQAFSVATGVTTLPSPMVHTAYQTSGNALLALLA